MPVVGIYSGRDYPNCWHPYGEKNSIIRKDMIDFKTSGCPVCTSTGRKRLGNPRRIDSVFGGVPSLSTANVSIVQCRCCGLLYAYPFPCFSEDILSRMYSSDNNYFQEMTPAMEEIVHWANPERRMTAIEKFTERKLRRFLEIGSGEGFALLAAQRRNWEVYGQEISDDFADAIKKRTGINVMVRPVKPDAYPKDYFDCIYMDSVLEHVINPLEFMLNLHSFLAPQGVLYITLPNEDSFFHSVADTFLRITGSKATSRLMPFAPPYHVLGFTEKSLRYIASATGFEIHFLVRKYSYNYIKRFKTGFSPVRTLKRYLFGMLYLIGDAVGNGSNMEAVLIKTG